MDSGAPIVYFDIAGPDQQKMRTFYAEAFGWKISDKGEIAAESTGGTPGLIRKDPKEKLIYLGVADINATLKKIEALGGKTLMPRTVVPGVVTLALFQDPSGNGMGLAEFGSYPEPKKKS